MQCFSVNLVVTLSIFALVLQGIGLQKPCIVGIHLRLSTRAFTSHVCHNVSHKSRKSLFACVTLPLSFIRYCFQQNMQARGWYFFIYNAASLFDTICWCLRKKVMLACIGLTNITEQCIHAWLCQDCHGYHWVLYCIHWELDNIGGLTSQNQDMVMRDVLVENLPGKRLFSSEESDCERSIVCYFNFFILIRRPSTSTQVQT